MNWNKVTFIGRTRRPRGRPCIGDRAMTSTERNKRRLARLKAAEAELKALKEQLNAR